MKTTLAAGAALTCLMLAGTSGGAGPPEFPPSIEDTVRMDEWRFLGPFSVGYREGVQSAVSFPEDLTPEPPPGGTVYLRREYRSILAQGGTVGWETVEPDSAGWVDIEFSNVYWDTIMDIYGYAGLVNKTFAYAEIDAPAECRALIVAERVGTFYLNHREHQGGPYGHDFVRVPVVLKKGINPVVLSLTGFGGHRFRFEVVPAPSPVMILDDYTTPDLAEGETGALWAGITLLNTTRQSVDDAILAFGDGRTIGRREKRVSGLAPLCVKKVPVEIEVISPPAGPGDVRIPVSVTCGGLAFTDTMSLRIRRPEQSAKRTFISKIDNSCQYYAVLPPQDYDPGGEYALILSLHGAGVRAEGQVDAYRPKTWAFVVAPTNRRPFGFDWQDWGRLDALEVLEIARRTLPVDTSRVYLTGHSMGGHGTWHVGLNHPHLFAAMAPEAGWTSFELYIPWFLQKGYILGDPRAVGMRDLALREDKPLNFVENARNLPVFIVHGGVDDNVPTLHSRMFAQRLEELGCDYRYWEVPGRSHWWSDDSLGVSCVDYPEVMDFLAAQSKSRHLSGVEFKTVNLGTANRTDWFEITAQDEPMAETRISADLSPAGPHGPGGDAELALRICTRNVSEFTLRPTPDLASCGTVTVEVGGLRRRMNLESGTPVTFSKRAGRFRAGPLRHRGLAKTPGLYGPIKQAYFTPFVLVYGTQSDRRKGPTTDILLHQAGLQAFQWWRRGNGYVDVIPDTLVTDRIIADYNLILFGGPAENTFVARIMRHLPIRRVTGSKGNGIEIGSHLIKGRGLAAEFVYPNPLNPDRLVVVHMGTDAAGLGISDFFKTLYAGAGLPDYIVYDETVRTKGWAGVICTGFFDGAWKVDPGLMFLAR